MLTLEDIANGLTFYFDKKIKHICTFIMVTYIISVIYYRLINK